MTINESKQGSITILQVSGRLDSSSMAAIPQVNAIIDAGALQIVVDLSAVDYISSAGLRVLLTTAKHMQQAQGKMVLAAASPQAKEVLDMAGFAAIIPVFASLDQACAHFVPVPAKEQALAAPLSFAEEIYLLALDDHDGAIKPMPTCALDYALAGALLMELALENRIDTDLTSLKVISTQPTGDKLLDEVLTELGKQPQAQPSSYWLRQLADQSKRIEQRVLARLVDKQILKQEDRRVLWVFAVRRYPLIDNREVKEVRSRLRELVLNEEIPTPRDIVLLSLGNACWLLDDLFTAEESERAKARIAALARLDLIGQEMSDAIREIGRAMAMMAMPIM